MMWKQPLKYQEHFRVLCASLDSRLELAKQYVDGLDAGIDIEEGSGILFMKETLERVTKLVRFIQHCFVFSEKTCTADVVGLLQMKTISGTFESNLQDLVKSVPEWQRMTDEVVRTASSTVKLRPVLERVTEALQSSQSMTLSRLSAILEEVRTLQEGMRSQD